MKKLKDVFLGILVLLIIGALVLMVYRYEAGKTRRDLAKRIAELSPRAAPRRLLRGSRPPLPSTRPR